jgi:hypothetical protein
VDVGIRRIQIDREEWRKATATLRRWLLFWKPAPRPVEADESLAALLARRDRVRASQTGPVIQPKPELFQPEKVVGLSELAAEAKAPLKPEPAAAPAKPSDGEVKPSTASRLLEAKRRAQERRK